MFVVGGNFVMNIRHAAVAKFHRVSIEDLSKGMRWGSFRR